MTSSADVGKVMTDKQTCPRRMTEFGPWDRSANLDFWRNDSTCSFCGSLKPELLLQNMEEGIVTLGPTDKAYKLYVRSQPNNMNKFYFQHFTVEQQDKFVELYNMNPRPFVMSYPGHFYVAPFFTKLRVHTAEGGE